MITYALSIVKRRNNIMKHLVLVFLVSLQLILSSPALAWSPQDSFESAVESMQQCHTVIASAEESQQSEKIEEEEEEPDCE